MVSAHSWHADHGVPLFGLVTVAACTSQAIAHASRVRASIRAANSSSNRPVGGNPMIWSLPQTSRHVCTAVVLSIMFSGVGAPPNNSFKPSPLRGTGAWLEHPARRDEWYGVIELGRLIPPLRPRRPPSSCSCSFLLIRALRSVVFVPFRVVLRT